jgi:hypothetical protein
MNKNIKPKKEEARKKEDKELLNFLNSVKKGELGNVEQVSIKYLRIQEQTQIPGEDTEEYCYSLT